MKKTNILMLSVLLCGIAIAGIGTATAQESGNETVVVTETTLQLDDNVQINRYQWDEETGDMTVRVTNNGNLMSTVVLVEALEKGSESWGWREIRVAPGETTDIVLPNVKDRKGDPAVLAATQRGIQNQDVKWLKSGEEEETERSSTLWTLMLGMSLMGVGTVAVAWNRYHRQAGEPVPLEEEMN